MKLKVRNKAKWLIDEERGADGIYMVCSNCDEVIYITGDFKYCPNCGAKMEPIFPRTDSEDET